MFNSLEDFSRKRSEAFSFSSGGPEVGAEFAQRCSSVRNRPQPFADDRGEGAIAVSLGEAHKI